VAQKAVGKTEQLKVHSGCKTAKTHTGLQILCGKPSSGTGWHQGASLIDQNNVLQCLQDA